MVIPLRCRVACFEVERKLYLIESEAFGIFAVTKFLLVQFDRYRLPLTKTLFSGTLMKTMDYFCLLAPEMWFLVKR